MPSGLLPEKLCGLGLRTLGAVLGTALAAILHAGGIQSTTDDVVTDTGKVFHTAAANHDDGVFLKVVAFTGDVRGDFEAVGEAHTGDLTQSRVRLLRGGGVNTGAHATTLGASLQGRGLFVLHNLLPRDADKLVDSWHLFSSIGVGKCSERSHSYNGYFLLSSPFANRGALPGPSCGFPFSEEKTSLLFI